MTLYAYTEKLYAEIEMLDEFDVDPNTLLTGVIYVKDFSYLDDYDRSQDWQLVEVNWSHVDDFIEVHGIKILNEDLKAVCDLKTTREELDLIKELLEKAIKERANEGESA